MHRILSDLGAINEELFSSLEQFNLIPAGDPSENFREHPISHGQINYCDDYSVVESYFWVHVSLCIQNLSSLAIKACVHIIYALGNTNSIYKYTS
jgi:hypothetical protein